jgi:hypothetical protein
MGARAAPGDVLFFHFSGHGTLVPPVSGHGGRDDEAIVPCDFNLITGLCLCLRCVQAIRTLGWRVVVSDI